MRYLIWIAEHQGGITHYFVHLGTMITAAYYWFQHSILKDVLEDKLERRHDTMINPITIVNDVNLAVQAVEKLKAALPLVTKLVADIKQAYIDKADSVKLEADLAAVLNDVNTDLAAIATLFPSQQTVASVAPPAA